MFMPSSIMASNFHSELAKNKQMPFGVFSIEHKGMQDAKDANGNVYHDCSAALSSNVDYKFEGALGMAKVIKNEKIVGPIQWVTNLEISIKAHPSMPVIGAVQIDIAGKSNNGIPFTIGIDFAS
jgi:hypothetical protein